MNTQSLRCVCLSVLLWFQPIVAYLASDTSTVIDHDPRRIVVIGDIHGAFDNFQQICIELGLIDAHSRQWIANDTILVQMGDLIHRREHNVKVVETLLRYKEDAPRYHSNVYLIMGNHDYEQLKWNPQNKADFDRPGSPWYMPDHQDFYGQGLIDKLRTALKLAYKINGFLFVHSGIEKKHLDVAQTSDVDAINALMSTYYEQVTFENQLDAQFERQRKIGTAVWLQWYHEYKRQNVEFCHKVRESLDLLDAHTIVVGHYFPSSQQQIESHCADALIFTDVGIWYNFADALIVEHDTIRTLSGSALSANENYIAYLSHNKQEL